MIMITYLVLGAAMGLFILRLLRGPSLTDRAMSLDGMAVTSIAMLTVRAVNSGDYTFLPVAVVLTLVGFIGTAVIARFIEGQGG